MVDTISVCAENLDGIITMNSVTIEALKKSDDFVFAEVQSFKSKFQGNQKRLAGMFADRPRNSIVKEVWKEYVQKGVCPEHLGCAHLKAWQF